MDRVAQPPTNLRDLPSVRCLLDGLGIAARPRKHPRAAATDAVRRVLGEARAVLCADPGRPAPTTDALLDQIRAVLRSEAEARERVGLRRVINATGIVLHTNLGRAPLPQAALDAVRAVGAGYSNLEFDLAAGSRGARTQGIEPLLAELTGAEAGLAVNNAAAAVLLGLSALAGDAKTGGGEVIVSRGELVEIGGGFRIPDVIRQGGARLVEVGTTNKTRLADYAEAIGPHTRLLLKVHRSNYRIVGFTAEATVPELAALARERGLPLMHDLGSGALLDLRRFGRPHEPTVRDALADGADLVAFSGDKLLGGPQAGILVGRTTVLAPLRCHPLLRALRLDKMSLAALEATLRLYRDPDAAVAAIPLLRILGQDEATLAARAERLAALLGGGATVECSDGFAGGGTLPDSVIPSRAVALAGEAEPLAAALRDACPAVVGRISGGRLLLDMLAVGDDEVPVMADALKARGIVRSTLTRDAP